MLRPPHRDLSKPWRYDRLVMRPMPEPGRVVEPVKQERPVEIPEKQGDPFPRALVAEDDLTFILQNIGRVNL